MKPPVCPYCRREATLLKSSAALYAGRDYGPAWVCLRPTCDAWTGCHPGTERPLGRLANAELRQARQAAHKVFDPLWQAKLRLGFTRSQARGRGYRWLAEQMRIDPGKCHIAMFDPAQCRRVVAICTPYVERMNHAHDARAHAVC